MDRASRQRTDRDGDGHNRRVQAWRGGTREGAGCQHCQYRKQAGSALGRPVQGPWGTQPSHCRCLGSELPVTNVGRGREGRGVVACVAPITSLGREQTRRPHTHAATREDPKRPCLLAGVALVRPSPLPPCPGLGTVSLPPAGEVVQDMRPTCRPWLLAPLLGSQPFSALHSPARPRAWRRPSGWESWAGTCRRPGAAVVYAESPPSGPLGVAETQHEGAGVGRHPGTMDAQPEEAPGDGGTLLPSSLSFRTPQPRKAH